MEPDELKARLQAEAQGLSPETGAQRVPVFDNKEALLHNSVEV